MPQAVKTVKKRNSDKPASVCCAVTLCSSRFNLLQVHFTDSSAELCFFFAGDRMTPNERKIFDAVQTRYKRPVQRIAGHPTAAKPFGPYFAVRPSDEDTRSSLKSAFCEDFYVNNDDDRAEPEDPDNLRWLPTPVLVAVPKESGSKNAQKKKKEKKEAKLQGVLQVWSSIQEKLEPCLFRCSPNFAQQNLEHAIENRGEFPDQCILFWKMGAGKTIGAIRYARMTEARRVLVIASKTLISQWETVLRKTLDCRVTCTEWTLVSYERFCELNSLNGKYKFPIRQFDLVVVDEAHYFKNLTGSKAYCVSVLFQAKRTLYLTGTPLRNDEGDLAFWTLAMGGPDLRVQAQVSENRSLSDVCSRFAKSPGFKALFANKIHCFDPVSAIPADRLHLNYPYVVRRTVETPLTLVQNVEYSLLTSGLLLSYTGSQGNRRTSEVQCQGPLKLWQRTVPLTGVLLESGPAEPRFVSAKALKFAEMVVQTANSAEDLAETESDDEDSDSRSEKKTGPKKTARKKSVILYSRFRYFFAEIKACLKAADKNLVVHIICGDTEVNDRSTIIEQFNSGKVDVLMLCRVGGEGVDLNGASALHVFEPQLNQAETEQAVGRAVRFHQTVPSLEHARTVRIFEHVGTLPRCPQDFYPSGWTPEEETEAVSDLLLLKNAHLLQTLAATGSESGSCSQSESKEQLPKSRRQKAASQKEKPPVCRLQKEDHQNLVDLILQANRQESWKSVDQQMHKNNLEKARKCEVVLKSLYEVGFQTTMDEDQWDFADEDRRSEACNTLHSALNQLNQQVTKARALCISQKTKVHPFVSTMFEKTMVDILTRVQEISEISDE